jgi:hypothetical protein
MTTMYERIKSGHRAQAAVEIRRLNQRITALRQRIRADQLTLAALTAKRQGLLDAVERCIEQAPANLAEGDGFDDLLDDIFPDKKGGRHASRSR